MDCVVMGGEENEDRKQLNMEGKEWIGNDEDKAKGRKGDEWMEGKRGGEREGKGKIDKRGFERREE